MLILIQLVVLFSFNIFFSFWLMFEMRRMRVRQNEKKETRYSNAMLARTRIRIHIIAFVFMHMRTLIAIINYTRLAVIFNLTSCYKWYMSYLYLMSSAKSSSSSNRVIGIFIVVVVVFVFVVVVDVFSFY